MTRTQRRNLAALFFAGVGLLLFSAPFLLALVIILSAP